MNNNEFLKVSLQQYKEFYKVVDEWDVNAITREWGNIILPQRKTKFSAGYDFHMPFSFELQPHDTLVVATGIKCSLDNDKVLQIYPRSGLGFKYGVGLVNTVGIIDSDYINADNEGHIVIKIHNPSEEIVELNVGDAFAQGIITQYFTTRTDKSDTKKLRTGGFGSTNVR